MLLRLVLASSVIVAIADVPWKPGRKSHWPTSEPKPIWWTSILSNASVEELEEPELPSGSWSTTAAEAVRQMGKGINLGNTFDMPDQYPTGWALQGIAE